MKLVNPCKTLHQFMELAAEWAGDEDLTQEQKEQ
jgi:hypothetical protein